MNWSTVHLYVIQSNAEEFIFVGIIASVTLLHDCDKDVANGASRCSVMADNFVRYFSEGPAMTFLMNSRKTNSMLLKYARIGCMGGFYARVG